MNSHSCSRPRFEWQNPPWILRAYLVFTLLAAALAYCVYYAPQLNRRIVPFTGWTGLFSYIFTLFFAILARFAPDRKKWIRAILLMHVLLTAQGVVDGFRHEWGSQEDFGNPYLMYHPLRPLVTIGLPIVWGLLLISPPMRRWAKSGIDVQKLPTI